MTPEEAHLWARLRGRRTAGLDFRRQHVIDGFVVDFYCQATGVIVEVDGPVHDQRGSYDAERDHILAAHELTVLRFTNDEIRQDLDRVLRSIVEHCVSLGSRGVGGFPAVVGLSSTPEQRRATRAPRG